MTVYHMDMNRKHYPFDPTAERILTDVRNERFDISIRDSLGWNDAYHKRFSAVLTGSPNSPFLIVSDPILNVQKTVHINSQLSRNKIHEEAAKIAGQMHQDLIRKTLVAAGFTPAD